MRGFPRIGEAIRELRLVSLLAKRAVFYWVHGERNLAKRRFCSYNIHK